MTAPREKKAKAAPVPPPPPPMRGHPVNGAKVLRNLDAMLRQYIVMGEEQRIACVLWIVHTYCAEASYFTPYLHVFSPVRECGKSTLLAILESVARRALKSDAMTPAAMYRLIKLQQPALLLDELDTLLRTDGAEKLRGVLNSGFRRDGAVHLCEGDAHAVQSYPTFCPKVLAGIGNLWATVASRSVPLRLDRATSEQRRGIRPLRGDRIREELEDQRLDCARWAHDHFDLLANADPVVPSSLGARAADIWRPLLAIADQVGEEWPALSRLASETLSAPTAETDYGLMLLEDVAQCVMETPSVIVGGLFPTAALLTYLLERDERPWQQYKLGRELTKQQLARLFSRFDITPRMERVGGSVTRGYAWHELRAAVSRYTTKTPPALSHLKPVTTVTHSAGGMAA